MTKEKAVQAAPTAEPQRGKNGSVTSFPMSILPNDPPDVKVIKELDGRKIDRQEIVDVVRQRFEGFDNTLISKCKNHQKYGVGLRREAVKLLRDHFAIEAPAAKRQPLRRKPKRIQCRLTDEVYASLQRLLADRRQTAQEYLEAMILADLQTHAKELRK